MQQGKSLQSAAFTRYLAYFQALTKDSVAELRELVISDFHFVDPFNDLRSVDEVIDVFVKMFRLLNNPRFTITDHVIDEKKMWCQWEFSFSTPLLRWGKLHTIKGVSVVTCDDYGKIAEHIDFWDASTQLYMYLPMYGWSIWLLRKLFG